MKSEHKHLKVRSEDHKAFKELAKIEGMEMQALFSKVVKKLKKEQLIKSLED